MGSEWTGIGTITSTHSGKDYLSVALLPDGTPETPAFYRKYAFSFVKKPRVSWQYHEASARLISTWAAETEVNSYKTVRGEMKVAAGPSFHTSVQFNGILPAMPQVGMDMAAAFVAQFDPASAKQDKWGGMVEMLIREVNSWDDNDPMFGRFRYFDPYEGHGWAAGMGFDRGNNQESSTESMNCNAGIILWGIQTGNSTIRDLGIFMYVNKTRSIEQYWFDVDEVVFPQAYTHCAIGMLWSNGKAYSTWFAADVAQIHGINILPIAAGSL